TAVTQPGGVGTAFHVFGTNTYGQAGATANPLHVTITDVGGAVSNATSYTPTVAKADLYVTATANSKTYGDTATDSGSLGGVLNNDGVTAGFSSAGDAATADVGTGTYLITAMLSDPNSKLGNYTVHETDANLTVNKANSTVTVDPTTFTYDTTTHSHGTYLV